MDLLKEFVAADHSDQIYGVEKVATEVKTARNVYNSIFAAIGTGIMGVAFFFLFNKLIGVALVLVAVLMPVMALKLRKQEVTMLDKSGQGAVSAPVAPVTVPADETVVDYVVDVMAGGMRAGTTVIGSAGAMAAPENSIILTNQNVRFIYVPMPGADIITQHGGNAAQGADFLFAHDEMETKLKALLAEGGLSRLVSTSTKNFAIPYTQLVSVHKNMFGNLIFESADGKKYTYAVRRSEDRDKLLALLKDYVRV